MPLPFQHPSNSDLVRAGPLLSGSFSNILPAALMPLMGTAHRFRRSGLAAWKDLLWVVTCTRWHRGTKLTKGQLQKNTTNT